MDEYQEHDLDDAAEGLKADLMKLTQLLESELDEIEPFDAAEDSLNEGEEDRYQLTAVVGSYESPDVGLYERRSRELPAGIPLELIEEDRRAREQRRRPGRQRFSGIGRDGDVSSDEEATGTSYNRAVKEEDGLRQTLTGRRLKCTRSDRGSVSPRDPGADGHEVDAEEDAEEEEEEAEDEDVGEEHTKEHISAAEDSCESPSQDENVLDAMEGDDEKTASDVSVDACRDDRSGEARQMIAVKVEDFYDDEAERGDDYQEEFARAPKRKRPAKATSGRKGSKKMKKKQRRSFEDRREAWDQLWEEKFQELVKWKEEKGVCAVGKSDNNKTLAWWIHEQRRKMRHGTLTEYRRARLESIGFVWSSELDGRAGRRRRYLEPLPKEDAISVLHLAPAPAPAPSNPHELAMATMMTTIMKRPSNGDGKTTSLKSARGGRLSAKASAAMAENGDDDRMEDEEEPTAGTRMQLRSASPRNLPEPEESLPAQEESLPAHLARQPVPLLSFYDVFLKREQERKRDKKAMEAMLAHLQEERDNDKARISRLEETVRQLSEKASATSIRAVANHSKSSKRRIKVEAMTSDDDDEAGGGLDLSAEPNNAPVPPPYPPSPSTNATTLAPASLQTPVNIGVVEAVAWKRGQQQQQREKIHNEREQAKARGMHQLLEDGKILANVAELEIEQFFV